MRLQRLDRDRIRLDRLGALQRVRQPLRNDPVPGLRTADTLHWRSRLTNEFTRRQLVAGAVAATAGLMGAEAPKPPEVVDIHQHTHYSGRSDETLIAHQRTMGIARTVLLPAGSKLGLDADCYGNDSVVAL